MHVDACMHVLCFLACMVCAGPAGGRKFQRPRGARLHHAHLPGADGQGHVRKVPACLPAAASSPAPHAHSCVLCVCTRVRACVLAGWGATREGGSSSRMTSLCSCSCSNASSSLRLRLRLLAARQWQDHLPVCLPATHMHALVMCVSLRAGWTTSPTASSRAQAPALPPPSPTSALT